MRFISGVIVMAMLAGPASAQDTTPVIEIPEIVVTPTVHEDVLVIESAERDGLPGTKVADKKFWFVGAALSSMMLVDTWTTFDVIRHCATCREANPVAAPFVSRGPVVTAVAGQAFDVGVMAIAAKMKGSDNPKVRRLWWLMPIALTTGHVWAAQHNWRLAESERRAAGR